MWGLSEDGLRLLNCRARCFPIMGSEPVTMHGAGTGKHSLGGNHVHLKTLGNAGLDTPFVVAQ